MPATKQNGVIIHIMKIGLIGDGYWGKKIYEALAKIVPECDILVFDLAAPTTNSNTNSLEEILSQSEVTHCIIATPENTHYRIAQKCLTHGKNLFVEKPLTLKGNEAKELILLAHKKNLRLYVDYIFLHDENLIKIKKIITEGMIGDLTKIISIRHSQNHPRKNLSPIDDLLVHDLYLGRHFFTTNPTLSEKKQQSNLIKLNYYGKKLIADYQWNATNQKRIQVFIGTAGKIIWDKKAIGPILFKPGKKPKTLWKYNPNQTALKKSLQYFLKSQNSKSEFSNYLADCLMIEKLTK